MSALAIGVVGEEIEHRNGAQLVVEIRTLLVDREVVLTVVDVDEPLHRPLAVGTVAQHCRRHEIEAQLLAEVVGGDLSAMKSGLEVPQWPLAAQRLADRLGVLAATPDVNEKRRVAAPGHATDALDLAARQHVQLMRPPAQFIRGHAWPSGSIGLPHHWHGGRPAATIESV